MLFRGTRGKVRDGKMWPGRERDGTATGNRVTIIPHRDFPLPSHSEVSCSRPERLPFR